MKNRLCNSISNKFVLVSENVDVSDVIQTGVDCSGLWFSYQARTLKTMLQIIKKCTTQTFSYIVI